MSKKTTNLLLRLTGFAISFYLLYCGTTMAFLGAVSAGVYFSIMAGIFFLAVTIFSKQISVLCRKNRFFYVLRITAWLGIVIVFGLMLFIGAFGNVETVSYTEDAVIVLGAGLNGDKITYPLAYRLDKAVSYSEVNRDAIIVVSGGQGPNETVSEAEAMKKYLIQKGIDPSRIITEEKSTSTSENIRFSKQLLDQRFKDGYTCAVITNRFHVFRAGLIAKKAGLRVTFAGAPIKPYSVPANYLREVAALFKYALLGH